MATRDRLRQLVTTQPFRLFAVKLAGGQSFTVRHPGLVACSVNGREMTVYDDAGVHLVEMLLVAVMEPVTSDGDGPGKRPKKKGSG
ncbi:MAG: hypothetical protein ACHRXM_25790 [Isosphaerales bacterium]